ncbi:hypothetical protein [Streptomyces sp. NPDC047525]|uniref:hypothetical protein n=1 Tax=Streptomyces sp. NPDC047525 TaxID=3155264 RepID=UPI0033EBCC51
MEGRRRVRLADKLGINARPDAIGPRLLILLEEVNATMKQLASYWERTRESGDPKVPAVDALNEILYMGRQVRMHVLLVAQSATARALGGPEVREQFATRILARYSLNAWRMLAPEVHPAPKSTKHPGRAQVVIGGSASETQVLFFTDAEAREWATTGEGITGKEHGVVPARPSPVQLQKPPAPASSPADFLNDAWSLTRLDDSAASAAATSVNPAPVDDDQRVGLREAQQHHLPDITVAALCYARANDRTFPGSVDKRGAELLYRVGDLKKRARNRPRAVSGTTDLD